MRRRVVVGIAVIQSILFLTHWFLYETWISFGAGDLSQGSAGLAVALGLLSISFLSASLLAWRFSNRLVRWFYSAAAVWAGFLSYFVLAACACWLVDLAERLAGMSFEPRKLAEELLGLALVVGLAGMANANWIRVTKIEAPLANLPEAWHTRVVAFVSDFHLGHVRNIGFARRVAAILKRLQPDTIFIGGDLYDGTAADLAKLAQPFGQLGVPLGVYFVAGNHEEFGNPKKYLEAVARAGIRVLDNEKEVVEGLQIVGVHYRDSIDPVRYRSVLRQAKLDPAKASVLLTHAPNHLAIPDAEGIAFELCGHTHAGQLFPFRWMPKMVYGDYVYGLHRAGRLTVYTSSGVGTWGPPLRVGTAPEIVLIRLVAAKNMSEMGQDVSDISR